VGELKRELLQEQENKEVFGYTSNRGYVNGFDSA